MKVPFTAAFLTAIFLLLTGCREEKKMESDPVPVPPQKEKLAPKEELENASFLCYADSMYVVTKE